MTRPRKPIFGVGINDADYVTRVDETHSSGIRKVKWECPFYRKWRNMLKRSYSEDYKLINKTYQNCSVVDEWLYFSNFKAWMETQDWQGKHLDKDLLVSGNKEYGPNTCLFIDQAVNKFLRGNGKSATGRLMGILKRKDSDKYAAVCCSVVTGKACQIGVFKTPEEAHKAWLCFKLEQAHILAEQQTDERIAKALINRVEILFIEFEKNKL